MSKILVTTDFSKNAKAAVLFAIQLASQTNCTLTFFHSYQLMRPTQWNDAVFLPYEESEHTKAYQSLTEFVKGIYESVGIVPKEVDYVAEKAVNAAQHILEYASKNNYDFICVSRKGHGKSSSLFGSTSSKLISKSAVPVIAVPEDYQPTEISMISYASDLTNLTTHLKKVSDFSTMTGAKVEVLHFRTPMDELINPQELERITVRLADLDFRLHFENLDHEHSLIENINKAIDKSQPSMMIMFTQQKRSLFERIFLSSISAEYSAVSKIPLLVFRKE